MDIQAFVEKSLGRWRSQRSAHHLVFQHFEAVQSDIKIEPLSMADAEVIALCQSYDIDPAIAVSPFRMTWAGQSDWDDEDDGRELKGTTVLVPVPDPVHPHQGRLLRDQGYAEEMAAIGQYRLTDEGEFILQTQYDRAMAEEKIWFVTPNLRMRVSLIKTSAGSGVVTASFSSEIRQGVEG
jgi:phycoerythrin-associated linker protein